MRNGLWNEEWVTRGGGIDGPPYYKIWVFRNSHLREINEIFHKNGVTIIRLFLIIVNKGMVIHAPRYIFCYILAYEIQVLLSILMQLCLYVPPFLLLCLA